MGSGVDPDHQGKMLMVRMLSLRAKILKTRQVGHMLGLVAVDNVMSIISIIRSGGLLIGFERDKTAMNYLAYGGIFEGRVTPNKQLADVDVRHYDQQKYFFEKQNVISGMKRSENRELRVLFSSFKTD